MQDKIYNYGLVALVVVAVVLGAVNYYKSAPRIYVTLPSGQTEEVLGTVADNATNFTDVGISATLDVTGATTLNGGSTLSGGDARIASLVKTGSVSAKTASTTATTAATNVFTTADICDKSIITTSNGATGTVTWTLPNTTTLYADCLTTNGDSRTVYLYNVDAVTSTIVATGGGGTLLYEASATVAATKAAKLDVIRYSSTAYQIYLLNLDN